MTEGHSQTIFMFVARIVFFRLHESPRFLVSAGRHEEALESLQLISRFNGNELTLELSDVTDNQPVLSSSEHAPFLPNASVATSPKEGIEQDRESVESEETIDGHLRRPGQRVRMASDTGLFEGAERKTYGSQETSPPRTSRPPSPVHEEEHSPHPPLIHSQSAPSLRRPALPRRSVVSHRSSFYEVERKVCFALPHVVRKPLLAWLDRMALVLTPEWRGTTILVWCAWFSMSLGDTWLLRRLGHS